MIKIIQRGQIFAPNRRSSWASHSFYTPTPILLNNRTIRIYGGMSDSQGVSRIGFIDVNALNPFEVLQVSDAPVLDIGENGFFDDNGIILGDVVREGDNIRLYYVGFQKANKVKFLAFSGLAQSTDNGNTFMRISKTPILDRTENAPYIRAIHSVLYDSNVWKIWYSAGDGWENINNIPYPRYHIRYTESSDGINFLDSVGCDCIQPSGNEYRIGRPRVTKNETDGFSMLFTSDTKDKLYSPGEASSQNGKDWERTNEDYFIQRSEGNQWDSEMICYPTKIFFNNLCYIFYSGNGMGQSGLGCVIIDN